MSFEIQWTERALTRTEELLDFIAGKSSAAARRAVDTLFDGVGALAQNPRLGRPHPRSNDQKLRRIVLREYIVIYRVEDASELVTILTVRHHREKSVDLEEVDEDQMDSR